MSGDVIRLGRFYVGMNPEQAQAIAHTKGACRLDSGAGSGKTRVVVHRIARLIEEEGVDPSRILAVTFSKKAADEMNARLSTMGITGARVGTWHALCLQILKTDFTKWAGWKIDDSDRAKYVLKDVIGYRGMDWTGVDFGVLRSFIGLMKANLLTEESPGAVDLASQMFKPMHVKKAIEAFRRYDAELETRGLLTFDDFLTFTYEHLTDEDNRRQWASKWDYVIQDEGQDASTIQVTLAKMLAMDHGNYMLVGDIGQSIYGWRGSEPAHFAEFSEEWPDTTIINMRRNYRSGSTIVTAANNLIREGEYHSPDMIPERGTEGSIVARLFLGLDEEAVAFAEFAIAHQANGGKWADTTALFRTNAQSRALEEALLSRRVPYQVIGGTSFYERKEVKDLLAYLRVASGRDTDGDAVSRCINSPFRYLGSKFVERVMGRATSRGGGVDWTAVVSEVANEDRIQARQRASAAEWAGIITKLREDIAIDDPMPVKPSKLLTELVQRIQYIEYLEREDGEESIETSTGANVRELIRVADRFDTTKELLDYIEENTRSARKQRADGQKGGDTVLLMSIHRSKGLEWPRVWVSGLVDGLLPHRKGDPEEERRLAYVAITRGRDEVVMGCVRTIALRGGEKPVMPSPFIADAGVRLVGEASNDGEALDDEDLVGE